MAIERIVKEAPTCHQNLSLENRESLKITGVNDVLCFSGTLIELDTKLGMLKISGTDLKIISISTSEKTAEIVGKVNSLEYKKQAAKKSLWQSVFK